MGAHVGELAQRLDIMNTKTENLSMNMQTVRDDIRHMRERCARRAMPRSCTIHSRLLFFRCSIKLIAENTKKTQQIVKLY
jgi:hypothetical protein